MPQETQRKAINVLLVDDDQDDFMLTRDALRDAKGVRFHLDWCPSFEKGLTEMVRNRHQAYLVDYQLGARTGVDLIKAAREKGCKRPLLILTGQGDLQVDVLALKAGAVGYLEKSAIQPQLLERTIRWAIEHHRAEGLSRQLSTAEHLQNFNQFAAALAHQIRNPAAYMMTNLSVMKDHVSDLTSAVDALRLCLADGDIDRLKELLTGEYMDKTLQELGEMLRDNLEGQKRIRTILEDLTALAHIERNDISNVEMDDLARSACDMMDKKIRKHATLKKNLKPVPTISADRGKLLKAVASLLLNAAQSMSEGDPIGNQIKVSTSNKGGRVLLTIQDSGEGIPVDIRERIFEPFFTTRHPDCQGLGLSIATEVVRRHGGMIRFDSKEGQGSVFQVSLPEDTGLSVSRPVTPSEPVKPVAERKLARARVLVIVHERELLSALQRLLAPHHEVMLAGDGKAGLTVIKRDQAFDVVICNLTMPMIDGEMIYEYIQNVAPKLLENLILLADDMSTAQMGRFIPSMADRILVKPVEGDTLLNIIEAIVTV